MTEFTLVKLLHWLDELATKKGQTENYRHHIQLTLASILGKIHGQMYPKPTPKPEFNQSTKEKKIKLDKLATNWLPTCTSILEYEPQVIAEQMTSADQDLYQQLCLSEFTSMNWMNTTHKEALSPCLLKYIYRFNAWTVSLRTLLPFLTC